MTEPAVEAALLNATSPKQAIDACVSAFEKKMTLESSEARLQLELDEIEEGRVAAIRSTPTELKHEKQPGHDGPECKNSNCSCVECDNHTPPSETPCRYHESAKGCDRGATCRFKHVGPGGGSGRDKPKGKPKGKGKSKAGKEKRVKCPDGAVRCNGKHKKGKCPAIAAAIKATREE